MKEDIKNIIFQKNDWDSKQLGLSCGFIDCSTDFDKIDQSMILDQIENLIKKNEDITFTTIKLHYTFIDILKRLKKGHINYIDTEFIYRCNTLPEKINSANVHFFDTYDPDFFSPLALEMKWSRFFLDNRIPKEKAQSLWRESIKNYCRGRSHKLAIAFWEDNPAGIVTINFENDKTIKLFIVGVLPEFQKKGIGTDLMQAIINKYKEKYEIFVEASSRNIGAQKLYEKTGFELYHMRYILHLIR